MAKIIQLSSHIANLIAAGEVVERPASVVKELLENAVDAGATQVTVEISDGGMTFIRVTDNGCGMAAQDAKTAFLRHATSKLRTAEDLAAIHTMGFRGEALAAIASVSRIELMTKTPGAISGTGLTLEAGTITEESEVGCPEGTTIIIRDLFFNTPARMKFMKADTVEGSRVTTAVQLQALAHPETSIRFIKDGKQILQTPGTGDIQAAVYSIYGNQCAQMIPVESHWEDYELHGFVSKPTDARPSRNLQTFFVNGRPVKSRLMMAALEEAYRNQIMVGKFPACVLYLTLPAHVVDVNVHPAKTEVKFLNEKAVFDCVHYGTLGALNKTVDRPQVQFPKPAPQPVSKPAPIAQPTAKSAPQKQENFFRTMDTKEFKAFTQVIADAPKPSAVAAEAVVTTIERETAPVLRQSVQLPQIPVNPVQAVQPLPKPEQPQSEQIVMDLPPEDPWRLVGELYHSYIIVEQGEEAYLIDKHAAHERILFEKLKANQEAISSQTLLTPIPCRLGADACAMILSNRQMLEELGFEVDSFGEDAVLLRQIPMDLSPEDAADALETMSTDLMNGRRTDKSTVRDEVLHTVACKAAIKAGWTTSSPELQALVATVMSREDLKYCPHGRPICISLSKKQLEKQFKRV